MERNSVVAQNHNDAPTEEDAIERQQILNLIYRNEIIGLKEMKLHNKNLNFKEPHSKTDLDDRITPLACAAFLG